MSNFCLVKRPPVSCALLMATATWINGDLLTKSTQIFVYIRKFVSDKAYVCVHSDDKHVNDINHIDCAAFIHLMLIFFFFLFSDDTTSTLIGIKIPHSYGWIWKKIERTKTVKILYILLLTWATMYRLVREITSLSWLISKQIQFWMLLFKKKPTKISCVHSHNQLREKKKHCKTRIFL